STAAFAQGAATGAATGAVGGAIVGGPAGAAVGGTGGAVGGRIVCVCAPGGAVAGVIADDARPRFRTYVTGQKHPSYRYDREVRVGADLPSSGVTYYEVAQKYGVTKYLYTVGNDRTVLVDPGTHRIVEVID